MRRFQYLRQSMTLSLTRKGLLATISLATVLLTAGYLWVQLWPEVPVVFLVGLLWAVCVLRDIRWVASLLFVVLLSATVVGYMAGLSHILMLAAGCACVIAWDMHHFEGRLLDFDDQATKEIEKNHLQRLLMVITASFGLIVLDNWLQIRFQFILLVLVTILVIVLMNNIILMIRRAGRPAPPKE